MFETDVRANRGEDTPAYRVLCFSDDPDAGSGHDHVAAIETSDPDGGSTRWRAIEVIAAIRDGYRFVVEHEGRSDALLEPAVCPACSRATVNVDASVPRPAPC